MLLKLLAPFIGASCVFVSQVAFAELVTGFEVVVGGNLSAQSQIQGRTIVGGNVQGGFPSFGTGLTPAASFSSTDVLVVGGSLQSNGITMQAGDARLGGTRGSANVNLNGPGSELFQNDATAAPRASAATAMLRSASDYFSGLVADSGIIVNGSNVTFNAAPGADGVAVFDVPAALLTLQNANFALATAGLPAGTSYIFNVVGAVTGTPMGNFGAGFQTADVRSHVLWNFEDQTSPLSLSREWYGSILLPDSNLNTTSAINGGVYVGGDFTTSGDVRLAGYIGHAEYTPSAVPEPSSIILTALAGVGLVSARLRRRSLSRRAAAVQGASATGTSLSV
ncbi:hypothetical protein Pan44_01120 [Caulifigura coniformis]|uniref:Uncharacterized protein n=1 Tax=Caulifigura coniformis TaxID=2527983 RepID=A0A517S7M0_9PLAN|nr:collagen-binding domain-containing protein [Caulifigura coniformis]QDT52103.1 hypothetical protein Pan44_01120 [Caulifigura coniformis]